MRKLLLSVVLLFSSWTSYSEVCNCEPRLKIEIGKKYEVRNPDYYYYRYSDGKKHGETIKYVVIIDILTRPRYAEKVVVGKIIFCDGTEEIEHYYWKGNYYKYGSSDFDLIRKIED